MSDILSIFSTIISDEILLIVCISGYLMLLLYHYGGPKWNEFSDFDKITFSIILGFIALFLIILPTSVTYMALHNFFIFSSERNLTNFVINTNVYYTVISVICSILIIGRCIYGGPLTSKRRFHRTILHLLMFLISFSFFLMIFLEITFFFSGYVEYGMRAALNLIVPIFGLTFFMIYYVIIHRHLEHTFDNISFTSVVSKIASVSNVNLTKTSMMAVLIFVFVITPAIVGNTCIFKPEIAENGQQIKEIKINHLPLYNTNNVIIAEKSIEKYYVVDRSFLIPWIKINTGLNLKQAHTSMGPESTHYDINGSYFIFDGPSEQTNITVYGVENSTLSSELLYEVSYPSEYDSDIETITITLHNNGSHKTNIWYLDLLKDRNYTYEDDAFDKIKDFEYGKGYIGDMNTDGDLIRLENVVINGDSAITIDINLTKVSQ